MTLHALEGTINGRAAVALINTTTGVALPCHTFDDIGQAEDFVAWWRRRTAANLQTAPSGYVTEMWERWRVEREAALEAAGARDTVPDTTRSRDSREPEPMSKARSAEVHNRAIGLHEAEE